MASSDEKLDVIIFGASGFTGKWTVYEAVTVLDGYRWGVAGRSLEKLEHVLKEMGDKLEKDLSETPIIIADVNDEASLQKMAQSCRIVVNCCGPYRFFGEPVVRACVEAGTHHVDVSGEPQYMETMQLNYHKRAEEQGVYVVSACGFDSIPADMGIIFLEKNFDGIVNDVETYIQSWPADGKRSGGAGIHYGTWESAVYGLAHANELRDIRANLYPQRLPKFQPVLKSRPLMFQSEIVNGVCLPFAGADRSVVMRSQRFLYEVEKKRPVQMHAYIAFPSWWVALLVAFCGAIFGTFTKFALGRTLLLKYPKLFSFGFVSHEGPSEESMQNTRFVVIIKGKGWANNERLAEPTDQFKTPPLKKLAVKVSGTNPGYGATCVALLCSAVTVLKESDKMPGKGGVLPPGAAFAKTNLIKQLEKYEHGLKFEILAHK